MLFANGLNRKSPVRHSRQNFSTFFVSSARLSTRDCCCAPDWRILRRTSRPDTVSAMCLVHQRFLPIRSHLAISSSVPLHCHNGEINTVRGNANWMNARQNVMTSPLFDDFKNFFRDSAGVSDSATLDNAVELLTMTAFLPTSWLCSCPKLGMVTARCPMRKGVYEYHASSWSLGCPPPSRLPMVR